MDKSYSKQRRGIRRPKHRKPGLWNSEIPEHTNQEMSEDAKKASEKKSMDDLRKHLETLLVCKVAEKEQKINFIMEEGTLPVSLSSAEKQRDAFGPERVLYGEGSMTGSLPSPFEGRELERSNSSIAERESTLLMLRSSVSVERGFPKQSGVARRVTSETNESLPTAEMPARPRGLQLPVSTMETSTIDDSSLHWESQKTKEPPGKAEPTVPQISWSELKMVEELGTGQFASVSLALWEGVQVAYKEWHTLTDEESIAMVKEEAKTLASLLHPCVVSLYGMVRDGPSPGLVVEYLPHCSLRGQLQDMKQKGKETEILKVAVALRAARGMKFLHRHKVIHFDLKCDNLLCDLRDLDNPVIKIGDVGLSKQKIMTYVSGNMRGTLPWMAPELFPNVNQPNTAGASIRDEVNEKVDVYSFGVVLWEIWGMGAIPHEQLTAVELMEGIYKGSLELKPPENCDPVWKSLMEECLNRDPNSRPDFKSIVERLETLHQTILSRKSIQGQ